MNLVDQRLYVKGQSLRSWSPVCPWSGCRYFYSRKMKLWCSEPEHPVKMPYDCDAHWPFEGEKSKTKQKQKMNEQTQKPKKKSENYWDRKTDSPKCFSLNYWDSLKDILTLIILNMAKGEVVFSFQFLLGKHKTLNFYINWVCVGSCVWMHLCVQVAHVCLCRQKDRQPRTSFLRHCQPFLFSGRVSAWPGT